MTFNGHWNEPQHLNNLRGVSKYMSQKGNIKLRLTILGSSISAQVRAKSATGGLRYYPEAVIFHDQTEPSDRVLGSLAMKTPTVLESLVVEAVNNYTGGVTLPLSA